MQREANFSALTEGETGSIEVRFQPEAAVESRAILALGFDAPTGSTVTVGLLGTGEVDDDGDGWANRVDNCPLTPNPDQMDTDGDRLGDPCDSCPLDPANDLDADGVCGNVDNCPLTSNADQADANGDGIGDACEPPP